MEVVTRFKGRKKVKSSMIGYDEDFNDEVPSTSSQTAEQIEIIQGVVLPGISNCITE